MELNNSIQKIKLINSKIEEETQRKIFGYLLYPAIIGFFILKNIEKKIKKLEKNKEDILKLIKRDILFTIKKCEETYKKIGKNDTYLIYEEKKKTIDYFETCLNDLIYLKKDCHNLSQIKNLIVSSIETIEKLKEDIESYNKDFVERRKKEYDYLFKKVPFPLDDDQKNAIIKDDTHNLVIAGAGSGKTEVLTTRIAYLTERKSDKIKPDRILALAFQNKAAEEIRERIKQRYNINVKIKTFHALGLEILNKAKKRCNLYGGDNYDKKCPELVRKIFKELSNSDTGFQKEVVDYLKSLGMEEEEIRKETDFSDKEKFYNYMKTLKYIALDGTSVKSEGERQIMNFLLSHKINDTEIKVKYEEYANWMSYEDKKGFSHTPQPDFFLENFDIYLEHWSLDKNGKVPEWYEEDYIKNMEIKKEEFKKNNKYLVETSFGEFADNPDFFKILEAKITKVLKEKNHEDNFKFEPLAYEDLVNKVWDTFKSSLEILPSNIFKFITIAKTYQLTPEKLEKKIKDGKWSTRQKTFSKISIEVFREYENKLRLERCIDFCDMINLAIDVLTERKEVCSETFDHILVDEYQDISKQRYDLIQLLMNKNKRCKLFCVGDDWQSIMGFAGSNLKLFVNFGKYFENPEITNLKINYRSNKSIVDLGNQIIKQNLKKGDIQLEKTVIAHNNQENQVMVYSSLQGKEYLTPYYKHISEHCIEKIKEFLAKDCKLEDIMILARIKYNPKFNDIFKEIAKENKIEIKNEDDKNSKGIRFLSVHKSKGLQAKVVFILNMIKDTYGFPCEIESASIFEPAREDKLDDKEAEERRLFYVAVTRAKENLIIYTQKCRHSKFLAEVENDIKIEYLKILIV